MAAQKWTLNLIPTSRNFDSSAQQLCYVWTLMDQPLTIASPPKLVTNVDSLRIYMRLDNDHDFYCPEAENLSPGSTATLKLERIGKGDNPFPLPDGVDFPFVSEENSFWWPGGNKFQLIENENSGFKFFVKVVVTGPENITTTYIVDPEMVFGPGNGFSLPST